MQSDLIKQYLIEGKSFKEIQSVVTISKATLSYHKKKLGLPTLSCGKRYNWKLIGEDLDNGYDI